MIYEDFFKLRERPFLAAPQTARYYPATVIEQARRTIARTVERGDGPALVVGPAGTGKTLLCQLLAEQFAGTFQVAQLSSGRLPSTQALLQAILYELRLPYRGMDEGELRLLLLDRLEPTADGDSGLLLLVDEAHTLSWRLLEEVRLLTNIVRDGQPRVRAVLAGGSLLEERFASPRMSSFSQRLAARCYLESLDSVETGQYVRAQIESVGGDPRLFTDDALRSVYRATDGIPRLINQVCDHALILSSLGDRAVISSEAIEEAWSDLQQLPTPWTPAKSGTTSDVVEFGGLDDGAEEAPSAIPFRPSTPQPLTLAEAIDADQQWDVIEDHLARIEDDFEPAGSIGTEVELDFPEFGNPFAEDFADEEVLLERYATDSETFAAAPRVTSRDCALSTQLSPLDRDLYDVAEQAMALSSEVQIVTDWSQASIANASRTIVTSLDIQRLEGQSASDLIVIEDGATGPVWATPHAGKLEYRQLFARLRRG